jgi:hypothetical protein
MNTIGIFRKSGSRSRMSIIREQIEKTNAFDFNDIEKHFNLISSGVNCVSNDLNSIGSGFSSQSTSKSDLVDELSSSRQIVNTELIAIDLADILKQYFRELPECLFTNKLSQTLIDIFTCKKRFIFFGLNS